MNDSPVRYDLDTNKITVSVVIAAFNGEKFIIELLESIASQSHQLDEIIICDDCSTDSTINILESFKLKNLHLNIKIISNRYQLGITKNFSKAIKLSVCDLIFLADQDDIWHNDKVQVMLDAYITGNSSYIISDMDVLNVTGGLERFTWAELMEKNYGISKNDVMNGCAVVATRKFFRSCLPVPLGKAHDVWFSYCAKKLEVRAFLDKPLMKYRISVQGFTSNQFVDNLKLSENTFNSPLNGNLKTLIKQEKKIRLIIIKSLVLFHFILVKIKFMSRQ